MLIWTQQGVCLKSCFCHMFMFWGEPKMHVFPQPPFPVLGGLQGVPKPSERPSLQSVLDLWGPLPVGHTWKTFPGSILHRCPDLLNWLLWTWRNSSSTLSLSWITQLLTLSLRESLATLQRNLIVTVCIYDLVLSGRNIDRAVNIEWLLAAYL